MLKREMFVPAILLAILVFWWLPAFAQDTLWSRTYGGNTFDLGYSVRQTADGGYIVAGCTGSFGVGDEDVYLIKTNSTGDTLWSRTYGGSGMDWAYSVRRTSDGGYIVAGSTHSFGAGESDVYLIKTHANGGTYWSRTYGGSDYDRGYSVQQTTDGGYIVAGETHSFGAGYADVYLIKTDSLGDTLWSRTYGGSDYEYAYSVQQTTDGGYVVAGYADTSGAGYYDLYLIKTNSIGDTLWTRTYGGSEADYGSSVQQATDGGYIVVGWTDSFGAGESDVYLIKTDSIGDTLWTRTYGGSDADYGYSVQQTTDGGYIVAGETHSFGASYADVYLVKTNSLGNTLWTRTYGGSSHDQGHSVHQTTDGGYIVAGWTDSFGAGITDFMLTKLDSLGNACVGEFVSSTVMNVSPTVTSPATDVASPLTVVTSPTETVTSPATVVTTVCMRVCGDVTGDGIVNIADVVYLVNYLYRGDGPPDPLEAGDVNCEGIIDVGDVVYLINYLYRGGPPPCC